MLLDFVFPCCLDLSLERLGCCREAFGSLREGQEQTRGTAVAEASEKHRCKGWCLGRRQNRAHSPSAASGRMLPDGSLFVGRSREFVRVVRSAVGPRSSPCLKQRQIRRVATSQAGSNGVFILLMLLQLFESRRMQNFG